MILILEQEYWKPAVFASTSDEYSKHMDLEFNTSEYKIGFPNCSSRHSLTNSKDIWFMLLESGSVEIGLKFWFKPVWLPVQDNEFCLDEVVDHDPRSLNMTEIDSHEIYHKNQILVYCNIAHFNDYLFHRKLFGSMCVTASAVVFILLIIYLAIWDKQNLAGWTQFNIFVALFFVVLMEGLRTLVDTNALEVRSTTGCVIIAAIAQYFFFAFNTTWTVMCFDLFYMFWKLETTSKTVARYRGRLILYLLFSWGLPLVVVFTAFYLTHNTATEEMDKMEGVYAFAHRRCSSPIRKLGFQTQGLMFLLNLLFFLLTTALIWKHRRGLNPAKKRSRNERSTWRSVNLFLKLVVVMGVTSLSIPLDYFFGSSDPLSTIAVFFRMVHFIPFVAVLFIFGFNEKNMVLISQKYPRVGKYFGFVACTSGATTSDTANHSQGNCNRISEHPSSPSN
ncbi:G-protein coupled receptor Mth2 [Orchesella cincta]|uniref:G-protein coupled receptor Mth2 n=1 Tax=Orchesella cincta TaxID=48709 RepID=A0A1D2N086_ORCCI|nr:G-protein coupled receptor Mth2 [Orchesella cincta]